MNFDIAGTIRAGLDEIEKSENVKIIYAAESGSRAWGFASPDSDYDVRFIYIRPLKHYLQLGQFRDVIEWQLDDTLDINGWDIQKALRLLHSSNPTLFEWARSPIVYKTTDEWQRILPIIERYFLSKSGFYHYIHMAMKNNKEFLQGERVKLKKYLYVLRPILACHWILEKGTPPPMAFAELVSSELDKSLVGEVERLLDLKMNSPEVNTVDRIAPLHEYIEAQLNELSNAADTLPSENKIGYEELNDIFYDLVLGETIGFKF